MWSTIDQGLILSYRLQGEETVYVAEFKPRLKIVTVPTVSIEDRVAKVAKYSNYNRIEFC